MRRGKGIRIRREKETERKKRWSDEEGRLQAFDRGLRDDQGRRDVRRDGKNGRCAPLAGWSAVRPHEILQVVYAADSESHIAVPAGNQVSVDASWARIDKYQTTKAVWRDYGLTLTGRIATRKNINPRLRSPCYLVCPRRRQTRRIHEIPIIRLA